MARNKLNLLTYLLTYLLTTIFRQQWSSNVQGMSLTLQLNLGNNLHQMSRACTSHFHYIYAIMIITCPGHVPDITTILMQWCSSNIQGMYLTLLLYLDNKVHQMSTACTRPAILRYLCNNLYKMSRTCTWHYHYIYAIMTIKCPGHVRGITTIFRQ